MQRAWRRREKVGRESITGEYKMKNLRCKPEKQIHRMNDPRPFPALPLEGEEPARWVLRLVAYPATARGAQCSAPETATHFFLGRLM